MNIKKGVKQTNRQIDSQIDRQNRQKQNFNRHLLAEMKGQALVSCWTDSGFGWT
jgi:hypothetical protein